MDELKKEILLFADEDKNIVIFPKSWTKKPVLDPVTKEPRYGTWGAYFPIELKYPYTSEELAEKIAYGFDEFDKHPSYIDEFGKKGSLEEKYYGVKGFKNASKGKRHFVIKNKYYRDGNRIYFCLPWKTNHTYYGVHTISLPEDAEWMDFAKGIIECLEMDITQLPVYKHSKSSFNL